MNLKDMVKKFLDEVKAGKVGDALDTGSDILKAASGFYKLVFGTAEAVDLDAEFEELTAYRAELMKDCSCGDGSCQSVGVASSDGKAVNPGLILALVDVILKIIAERRKNK